MSNSLDVVLAGAIWSSPGSIFVTMNVERMLDCECGADPNARGLKNRFLLILSQSYLDFACCMYVWGCYVILNTLL